MMEAIKFIKTRVTILIIVVSCFTMMQHVYSQKSDPLPAGWKSTDIGEPELPSVVYYNAEEDFYTLSGGGYDTWGTADEANFVYFETEEDKEVVVRMLNYSGTGWNSKGFIMIRGSLDPGSTMCFLEATPHSGSSVYLSGRPVDKGNCSVFGQISGVLPLFPRWIKFVRQGKYITGYHKDDTEGAQWERVATVQLALKGKAYLGIGVCGGGSGTGYATISFDKLVVRNIEIPYEVVGPVADQVISDGNSKNIDVTSTFGHYIGDYWVIDAISSDDSIVTAQFSETRLENSAEGEEYQKLINITGTNDGVAVVRISTNIKGFKMRDEFVVEVNGKTTPVNISNKPPGGPWKFDEIYNDYFGNYITVNTSPYKQLLVPGVIEAEDFDNNGYFDTSPGNQVGEYRTDVDVDIDVDTIGNLNYITKIDSAEWLNYTVYVEKTGIYNLDIVVSSDTIGCQYSLDIDGEIMSSLAISSVDSVTNWKTTSVKNIKLNKGTHLLKLYINVAPDKTNAAIDKFTFTEVEEVYTTKTSKLEYQQNLEDSLKILTELWNENGLNDNLAFLYQDLDIQDSIQMTMFVESVKNTGTGSFAGLMLRQSFDTAWAYSPFVSFGAGAYEGLKLSFRWDNGVDVGSLVNEDIKLPCWIRLNKFSINGFNYINPYYSYDGIYWNSFLKYPLDVKFLDDNVIGGLAVCGGRFAPKRKELVSVKNLDIKVNEPFDEMKDLKDVIKEPVTISPNPVATEATISYKVITPGRVVISIYNSFGVLMDVPVNSYHQIGDYTITYNVQNLDKEGIYLLRYSAENDYQFVKFIYNK